MPHLEARELLVDLETNRLEGTLARSVAGHVESCRTCRRWLETYRLFASAVRPDRPALENHPDSDLLTLWGLHPEELDEPARLEVSTHLKHCGNCRWEADVVRDAVTNSRPSFVHSRHGEGAFRRSRRRRILAAAAVLGTFTVGLALVFPSISRKHTAVDQVGTAGHVEEEAPEGQYLVDVELAGDRAVEAADNLNVKNVKVTSGARVTLRAGKRIVFSNGFEIASGARATIGTSSTTQQGERDP